MENKLVNEFREGLLKLREARDLLNGWSVFMYDIDEKYINKTMGIEVGRLRQMFHIFSIIEQEFHGVLESDPDPLSDEKIEELCRTLDTELKEDE